MSVKGKDRERREVDKRKTESGLRSTPKYYMIKITKIWKRARNIREEMFLVLVC